MGRRFPEFCIIRAACRVSVKVPSCATGDDRVASYQAAINAVAAQHYAHWPFMVEVLNKWLEMNQDFVRDPIGYVAPNPPSDPAPADTDDDSPTISTIQDTPSQTTTSAFLTAGHLLTHSPSVVAEGVPFPPSSDGEAPERDACLSPVALTTGTETNDLDDPPLLLNGGREVPMPFQKVLPFSWIGALPFLSSLGGPGVGPLTSRNTSSGSRSWFSTPELSTQQMLETCRSRLSFLASFYKGWWNVLKRSFRFGRG